MQTPYTHCKAICLALLTLTFTLFSIPSKAGEVSTGWLVNSQHPPVETRFVVTGQTNPDAKTVEGFLEVKLADNWKTYWRSPGEGGISPAIDWQSSENIENVDWHWPLPSRFSLLGIETLGYKHSVIFPMTIHVSEFGKPVVLDGKLTLSSCTTFCVLTDYPLSLSFDSASIAPNPEALHLYNQGMSRVPAPSLQVVSTSAGWDKGKQTLQVTAERTVDWQSPDLLIDGNTENIQDLTFSRPVIETDGKKLTATMIVSSWLGEPELDGESLQLTLSDTDFSAEHSVPVATATIIDIPAVSAAKMILFALIGGLILNIMPCVLPVLGLKLASVTRAKAGEKRQIRLQFLASAAGIVASFWLLAALLTGLKLTGNAIGWGIQFQSPWFIGFMVLVTSLFAANMLGLFEIRLPANASTWMATRGGNAYLGNFIQGMFATLLATPCSAPFLGTAVAFALGADILQLFAIFTSLALGMALPWLLVALFPSIAGALPKPGAWMNRVKLLFGAMMLLTAIWLLSLLANHLILLWLIIIAVAIALFFLLLTKKVYGVKTAVAATGTGIVAIAFGLIIASVTANHWATPLPADLAWQPLSQSNIRQAVSEGNVVFVDVTADWCITCKANKIGVLLQDPVYGALNHTGVIPMKGDWTVPSQKITDYLQENGRFGVPFNKVYGPGAPEGIPLPVILTKDVVTSALQQAKG